jgi:hypothetical protein
MKKKIDLSCNVAGIRSPNPFWLASAPHEFRVSDSPRIPGGLGRRRVEDADA